MRALVLTAAGLLGCEPRAPDPLWTGSHLAYGSTVELEVCAGSWVQQDRYVAELSELLAVELPRPVRFTLIDESERETFCEDETVFGCARGDEAYSLYTVQLHELAHAVATPAGYGGALAFREGFAEVFSDGQISDSERLPIESVIRGFEFDAANYYTAGLFVRFLIEEYDLATLLAFLERTARDDGFEEVARVFEEVYGTALEAEFEAFSEYPSCTMWNNRVALIECSAPQVPWEEGLWQAASDLDCSDPEVLGPVPDGDRMLVWSTRGLEVPSDGSYRVNVTGDVGGLAGVRITRCGSCWDSVDAQVRAGQSSDLQLPAGRYFVTFVREIQESGTLDASLKKVM